MKICGLGCSMPERVVTNDDVLKQVAEQSAPHLQAGELEQVLGKIRALFRLSGTKERRLTADGERAYDHAKKAGEIALERARMKPTDIDLLLYVGVGRGWVEPGMGTFFQHEFGMKNATAFDLLDACLSWMRALHISYHFMKNGVYKNIMIMNAEFNKSYGEFTIKHPDELAYRFAQFTIGEAATATILSNEDTGIEPLFVFKTDPSRHDLCKIPLPTIGLFNDKERCPQLPPLVFFAYSADLFTAAEEMVTGLYRSSPKIRKRRADIIFAHSASATLIDKLARRLNHQDATVNLYSMFGNTVSASIPTAMWWSIEHDRLQRGMQMKLFMGSAGFSVGICHMAY